MYTYEAKKQKQDEPNKTGIPTQMKRKFENISGYSFADVRVHYNSDKPAKLGALAYTQGSRVFIGPGQEEHLGHELGHVVQQKQGHVRATTSIAGMPVNDDLGLEKDADRMLQCKINGPSGTNGEVVQRKVGFEFQTIGGQWNVKKIDPLTGKLETPGNGIEIMKRGDLTITSDGEDLEYVTKAYDERTEVGSAIACVTEAQNFHNNMCNNGLPRKMIKKDGTITDTEQRGDLIRQGYDWWINKDGEKTAHPQATVGVKLVNIHDLISSFLTEKANDLLGAGIPRFKEATKMAVEASVQTGDPLALDSAEKGFITLILTTVNALKENAKKGKTNYKYAKSAMPFMNRTSFYQMYKQLPRKDLVIQKLKELFPEDNSGYIYWFDSGNNISVKQLITSLEASKDAIHEKHSDHPVSFLDEDRGYTGYGISRPTDIGYDTPTETVHGTILELRALPRKVNPTDWPLIAEKVLRLMNDINNPIEEKEEEGGIFYLTALPEKSQ